MGGGGGGGGSGGGGSGGMQERPEALQGGADASSRLASLLGRVQAAAGRCKRLLATLAAA